MISIRLAKPSDAPSIIEFNLAMAMETEEKQLDRAILERGVQAVLDNPAHGFYVVAESDDCIMGSLLVTPEWSDWRNGLFWWIQSLYVLPQWRRRGVFRALYTFVTEQAAANSDVRGVRLYVEKNNAIARTCYETMGMRESIYTLYE